MALHVLAGTLAYALGQAFNLAFQLLLLRALGAQAYGRVGLAHLAFVTLLFVCDLGYSLFFLRERPDTAHWNNTWRLALGHRLVASLLAFLGLMAFWVGRYGSADQGTLYLLAAAPAVLAALINFSAPLLAAGRQTTGFAMQQIAWPVATVCLALTWPLHGQLSPVILAGGSISMGYLAQALVNLSVMRRHRPGLATGGLLTPRFGHGSARMLKASLAISMLGFLGTANDRLTAFLVEGTALGFLPAYLLLVQALGGASGILGQINRLLVAHEASGNDAASPVRVLVPLLLIPLALLLLATAVGCGGGCWKAPASWIRLGIPVLLDWTLTALGGGMAAILIGRHREDRLARIVTLGITVSIAAQLAGAWLASADAVLWAKVTGALLSLVMAAHLASIRLPASLPLIALAAALGALSQAGRLPGFIPAAASLLVLAVALAQGAAPFRRAFNAIRRKSASGEAATVQASLPNPLALQTGAIGEGAQLHCRKPGANA